MDLEEELSLLQEDNNVFNVSNQADAEEDPKDEDTLLGLDQNIKLKTRAKVAKIDDERVLNRANGIDYIIKNHHKVSRVFKKREHMLMSKLNSHQRQKSEIKRLKRETEIQNLDSVIQFYQLWCHGLFPKAKFRDCIHMLRSLGSKSSRLRLYRRELIEREIYKLKVSKGIINESNTLEDLEEGNENRSQLENSLEGHGAQESSNLDDWSFMDRGNNLFVGDEDDLYHSPVEEANDKDREMHEPKRASRNESNISPIYDSDDAFSDDGDLNITELQAQEATTLQKDSHRIDNYEEELQVMKEMDL